MVNNTSLFRNITLLKALSDEVILTKLKSGKFTIVSYKKNSVVHLEGETCNKLEIVLSGKVVIDSIDESGNLLTISEFVRDDILGGDRKSVV